MQGTDQQELGRRIQMAREAAKLTQQDLTDRLGFKDRQTLSAIEGGLRKVSADELMLIMEATGRDLDFFTDRYRLVGEGNWSFRASSAQPALLDEFEAQAGRWVAAYRRLGQLQKQSAGILGLSLNLDSTSTFEEAQAAGEWLAEEWRLGDCPALTLPAAVEAKLDVLVLMVDAPTEISGAACQLTALRTILINRNDNPGRRHFDFAHELFHVLTWDRMPPERVDVTTPRGHKAKRVENLANNFAGALLMPVSRLKPLWDRREAVELHGWFEHAARQFRVSCDALYNRLRALDWMTEEDAIGINFDRLRNLYTEELTPPLFSKVFLQRVYSAIDRGDISVRKVLSLLETDEEGLEEMFRAQGLGEVPRW